MITIDKSTNDNTVNYFYNTESERFGELSGGYNHGFESGLIIKVVVDSGLYAHELDNIFATVFKEIKEDV